MEEYLSFVTTVSAVMALYLSFLDHPNGDESTRYPIVLIVKLSPASLMHGTLSNVELLTLSTVVLLVG